MRLFIYSFIAILTTLLSAAVHVKLTPEEVEYLAEPYLPRPILGH
jgi:hypothetical protein